ncbi:MAG: dihydropteroate synthase [Bacteroidetes bacterium]|nr:MAG: dihydropteroate synthase [Bacteroidota bacterium]
MFDPHLTLNCKGRLLSLDEPRVMGILNVTPDSFFDGGHHLAPPEQMGKVEQMLKEGADLIDIGGMSSRPGARPVSEDEELKRVLPVIENIRKHFPETLLSIDTWRARVAREAIAAGAHLVNDISAGKLDPDLYPTVGELGVPYVLMHMKGTPETMQTNPRYEEVVLEILDFFIAEIEKLQKHGVRDIVLDPGFGFGKTVEHNYQILKNLHLFGQTGYPVLAGISRKSMICKPLKINPSEALNGTTALHMEALRQGARILRVHDVREAKEVIRLWQILEASEPVRISDEA